MAGHRLGVLLWMCVCVLDGVAGICPEGIYGYRCGYQCHCPLDKCNAISGCSPEDCDTGWSGLTCQKSNIALHKNTSASSVHSNYGDPGNAVNGDNSTDNHNKCFHSEFRDNSTTETWWRVDLGEMVRIRHVIIYFRTDYIVRRNGIQIYIADTDASPTDGVHCYNVTGNRDGTDIPDVLKVTCSGEGRYIVLYTIVSNRGDSIPVLDFCEVEVNVCGPGTFGADCDNYCHCDGDVCDYVSGVCPSGICLPGWQTQTCGTACGPGTFGTNCNNTCHCDGETCNHVTGVCSRGVCLPGWQTETCDTACDPGTFGINCSNSCHCDGETCDHVTGVCPSGVCLPGWQTETCDTECDIDSYGSHCSEMCSSRKCKGDNSSCNHVAGECVGGCKTGWDATDCTQELQTHDPPLIHSISLVTGVIVGVVLTLLLVGGVFLYLLRTGRLTWMPGSVKEGETQDKADTNMPQSPDNYTSMCQLSHTDRRDMDANDYAGLDTDTRADNKHYDLIQN